MDSVILKPLGLSSAISSASNTDFSSNKLVRITHTANTVKVNIITCKYASNSSTKWSIALTGGQDIILEKDPTDTLTSNAITAAIRGVAVAYRN